MKLYLNLHNGEDEENLILVNNLQKFPLLKIFQYAWKM